LHDSNRTSASIGIPTPVDVGTPAGNPTPAGEPPNRPDMLEDDEPGLFQGDDMAGDGDIPDLAVQQAIGRIVLAWGRLEQSTVEKLTSMRHAFGDVRAVGGRARPTIQKLLAELRALVAMRDRHDKQALTVIAEIDGALQRIAQFRLLVVDGAQGVEGDALACRDLKNGERIVPRAMIEGEAARLDEIRARIEAL